MASLIKILLALATFSSAAEIDFIRQRNIDWHCEHTHSESCIRYDTVVPQYHFFGTKSRHQDGKYNTPEKCAAGNDERYYTQWCPKRELVCEKWEHKCLVHDRWSGKYDYWDRSEYGCLHFGWTDDFCNPDTGECFDDSWTHYCPDVVSTDVPDTPYGGCSSAGVTSYQENEAMCENQCLATPGCTHFTFRDGAETGTGDSSKGRPGSEGKCHLCRDATSDGEPCSLEENGCRYMAVPPASHWQYTGDVQAVEEALAKADEVCASDGNDMDAPVRLKVVRAAAKLSNLVKRILSNQHFDPAALEKNLVDRVAARLAVEYGPNKCEEGEEYDDENVGGWECSGGSSLWTTLQAFMVAADSHPSAFETLVGARAFPTLEDKGRQRLLEEHRVFLADDHYFGRQLGTLGLAINTIESFFANLPDHLKTEGVLGAGEPFLTIRIPSAYECKHDWRHSGNHDNEYFDLRGHGAGQADLLKFTGGHAGDAGNPWRAVVDVRKFDWGEGTDNAFEGTTHSDACEGDTSSEGCAGDRLLYDLREGVTRLFEQAYTYRQRRLRHRINNRVSDDAHWLRQVHPDFVSGPHAHMTSDTQRILPLQLGGQYLKSSHTQLLIAKAAAEAGNLWPLQWFLLDVDVVGRTGTGPAPPQPTAAPTTAFPRCGVRVTQGRYQDKNNYQCVTDPEKMEHAGKKIAFACCEADTCSRFDADGNCLAGDLRSHSNFAPKDWHEARDVCAAEGKVLCGVDEPCSRSGCSYDHHFQWTGEECQAGDEGLPAECATPAPAPTKPFPTCGVRVVQGRNQDPDDFQCVTDPAATEHAGKKIAFACCEADTCSRMDADGQCYAGSLSRPSTFAPKSWHEASDACAAEGKVLCGVDKPCTRTGCSYDFHYQWTGEECQAGDAGLPAECASVFYEEDGESHQVAALGVAVSRADKFGHVKPDGMIRHLKIPGCGVWSFTYNLKEIIVSYTAAADPIYGDPAVCAPPVIQHVDDPTRNDNGHCGRDTRDQVLCAVKLVKP